MTIEIHIYTCIIDFFNYTSPILLFYYICAGLARSFSHGDVSLMLLSILIISLGKRECIYVLFVHLFVYSARANFCSFSLPLGVRDWLRFVIVALPALFLLILLYSRTLPLCLVVTILCITTSEG